MISVGDVSAEAQLQPVRWQGDSLALLDQTRLPQSVELIMCRTAEEVGDAIRTMKVRGAPAIGVAAGYGYALAAVAASRTADLEGLLAAAYSTLLATRPTAVNLAWALDRMRKTYRECRDEPLRAVQERLTFEAQSIQRESFQADLRLSKLGAVALAGRKQILTHCNAGPLATAGYGTAVGVIRQLFASDRDVSVLADETRPFLQGARLTAWELNTLGIPVTIITDSMAGAMMRRGQVDAVVTGADRVAANGDVANKIGTYSLAVLAKAHEIPFMVAAPLSTVDLSTPDGDHIPIEERSSEEVTRIRGLPIAPDGVRARHPAFDVTPHGLITAIITENGVVREPYEESLRDLVEPRSAESHGTDASLAEPAPRI